MYILLALIAGMLTVVSISLNALLGQKVGIVQGILINFIAGFSLISLVLAGSIVMGNFQYVTMSGVPICAFFGGLMGCCITGLSNYVLPKIPVLFATMLMFVGQILCGIVIDFIFLDKFSAGQLAGGVLIAVGIFLVARVDSKEEIKESAATV